MTRLAERLTILALLAACCMPPAMASPATAAGAVFPPASRLGLVPTPAFAPATAFPGFEDREHNVFVRLIALPSKAFSEIEKGMTDEALKKQGMDVEKREPVALKGGSAVAVIVGQDTPAGRIRKWLLLTPIDNVTALVSVEMSAKPPAPYSDAQVQALLATLTVRPAVPEQEQLALMPFKVGDTAGLRLVRVIPGVAAQFTDGPKDSMEAADQSHLVIAAAQGGPEQARDRERFARDVMTGLPPFKAVRITSSDAMRIDGQPGYEMRAEAKDPKTDAPIEIVQWLRFGTGAYLRILGFGPKDKWTDTFMRFRAVRDGLQAK